MLTGYVRICRRLAHPRRRALPAGPPRPRGHLPADCDYSVSHTTCFPMSADYQNTDLGYYDGGNDTIYQINVATDTMVKITMIPDNTWTGIGLFTDCPDELGTMVASDTGSDKSTGKDKGIRVIDYTLLASEIIKVPHHGSSTSIYDQFLNLVNPEAGIISCGHRNQYGHPHPETLKAYKKLNTRIYRTDREGAIVVTSDGKSYRVLTKDMWM